jgi:hypothetical protein
MLSRLNGFEGLGIQHGQEELGLDIRDSTRRISALGGRTCELNLGMHPVIVQNDDWL